MERINTGKTLSIIAAVLTMQLFSHAVIIDFKNMKHPITLDGNWLYQIIPGTKSGEMRLTSNKSKPLVFKMVEMGKYSKKIDEIRDMDPNGSELYSGGDRINIVRLKNSDSKITVSLDVMRRLVVRYDGDEKAYKSYTLSYSDLDNPYSSSTLRLPEGYREKTEQLFESDKF